MYGSLKIHFKSTLGELIMNTATWSGKGHAGTLENNLGDSLLEIEWLVGEVSHIKDSASLDDMETRILEATNRLAANILALKTQESLDKAATQEEAKKVVDSISKKLKNQGARKVKVTTSLGMVIVVVTTYFSPATKKDLRCKKRKGIYPALFLLGIHDRLTPRLASEISSLAVIAASFKEAQQILKDRGIKLDVKTIGTVAQRYAGRAKLAQQSEGYCFSDTVSGCRVVVSIDGGRTRIREKKRGPKTPKNRSRFNGVWREPKLLIIYTVDEQGKVNKTYAPFMDATMKGPDAIFAMVRFYLEKIKVTEADKILFVADGARWIWNRVGALFASLGLSSEKCYELLDFYHAAEHLNKVAELQKKLNPAQRKRWFNKHRKMLLEGKINEVVTTIKGIYRKSRNKKLRTERDYFIRNMKRMRYSAIAKEGLPIGSGSVESAVRRVINLRLKGASVYWLKETAEAMLYLRAQYKSGRWNMLKKHIFSLKAADVI